MQQVVDSLVFVFTRIVPAILVGVTLANVAVELGLMRYIAAATRPITRGANLPDEAGGAILTCLASPAAGYSMLADYREKGRIDDRQTIVAVTINTFPGSVSHLLTYYVPVVIPILGTRASALYVGARLGIALAITLTGLLLGRLLLTAPARYTTPPGFDGRDWRERVLEGLESSYLLLRKVLVRIVAAYVVVSLLISYGAISSVTVYAKPLTSALGLNHEVAAIIATRVADVTSSFVVAGSLISGGSLAETEAVVALLVGSLLSLTVNTFKSSMPFQFAIWGSNFGTRVVLVNLILKLFFLSLFVSGLILLL